MGKTKPKPTSRAEIILRNAENINERRGLFKQPRNNDMKENVNKTAGPSKGHAVRHSTRQRTVSRKLLFDEVTSRVHEMHITRYVHFHTHAAGTASGAPHLHNCVIITTYETGSDGLGPTYFHFKVMLHKHR